MAAFTSPMRLAPPITPRRAPSPMMSPGFRRGRIPGASEESHLRDLSPETTLRAFAEEPVPFDTTRDEYKIFACIDTLTVAERDLGTRVAKAAQRLKSWCAEIEQWGWTGGFEQQSKQDQAKRRRSLEARIAEHVDQADALAPLQYYGSLLSTELEQHEARLDDMGEELLKLDVDELKEYVLDMHPQARSRPGSAGFGASRSSYRPMDDFSFLITQTLLSALPHHAQLKDRLNMWTARVSILRSAPRYLDDLKHAQRAMTLAWNALEPPTDPSDAAFAQWKEAVDTISGVLRGKVSDLGRRLDRMLDTLEDRDDCLPDRWIDVFETLEGDFGRWVPESTRRVIEFDVRRQSTQAKQGHQQPEQQEALTATVHSDTPTTPQAPLLPIDKRVLQLSTEPQLPRLKSIEASLPSPVANNEESIVVADEVTSSTSIAPPHKPVVAEATQESFQPTNPLFKESLSQLHPSIVVNAASPGGSNDHSQPASIARKLNFETVSPPTDDDFEFDEGDTIVHNAVDDSPRDAVRVVASIESLSQIPVSEEGSPASFAHETDSQAFTHSPALISTDGTDGEVPRTPRSRRLSTSSVSSNTSFDSSPTSVVEESPTARTAGNRNIRASRPELNAAMTKRRPAKDVALSDVDSAPWPPTQFSHKRPTTVDDLERKISDILTTIPAHIRLTSGPGADAHEIKPSRGIGHKGSRGYLRAARSASGLRTPQLTLSPVKNEFESANPGAGRKSANARIDNDIKLYHLTQPGKEQPIKLFIRRVGENGERVMVRVGGGWSDLGEYLRQYAEHHGRRTASEGKFEVLGLEVQNPDNATARPGSAMSTTRRFSGGRKTPSMTPDGKLAGLGISTESPPPPMPRFERDSTPAIAEEAPTPPSHNSQNSWHGTEVGLAGPKTKKVELTEDKLEWIEGMMKQARSVSNSNLNKAMNEDERGEGRSKSRSESRSASRSTSRAAARRPVQDFVDLGKTGSTRRVFMRGGGGGSSERLNER
ncbi:gas2 domain protein [Stagonosporopsis vannaccii]|nr:gas2 domain protein [Stagonosporopsis vannaccii]